MGDFTKKSGLPLVEGGNQQKTNTIISIAGNLTSNGIVILLCCNLLVFRDRHSYKSAHFVLFSG